MKRLQLGTGWGYTMVELLVVMAILGVLAAAILPLGESLVRVQKERELREALWQIRGALDEYKRAVDRGLIARTTESGYPPSLGSLVTGADDAREGRSGQRVYLLRQLPRDPFAQPELPPAATWRLRSYASPPDAPTAGADVFDVFSSSDQVGLDNRPYAKW